MKAAGVLIRIGADARFLPASAVVRLARMPQVTRVPGGPPSLLGLALHEGAIVPVLTLGTSRREMIVCDVEGELIGLVGTEVVRTGSFDVAEEPEGAVLHEGGVALPLELVALCKDLRGPLHFGHFAKA